MGDIEHEGEYVMAEPRYCMSDRIKNAILERICDGMYAPGERLVELQIAEEFKTSQAPVREAFCKLESMRLVETEPYKGTRVRDASPQEVEESLQVRGALESLAAEQVEDRVLKNIKTLKQWASASKEAAKKGDVVKYSAANLEFHRFIVEASNNQTLISVWNSLAPEIRMLAGARAHSSYLNEGANDHLEILEAFAEGDNRFAAKLLKKHTEAILFSGSKELERV
jgi:DNA-binding GntR family transcriptional regulator